MDWTTEEATYDGNLLAGPLIDIFAAEITTAVGRCAGCGQRSAIAAMRVYDAGAGLVGRCPGCASVTIRLARTPDSVWLDLTGISALQIPLPLRDPSAE